MKAHLCEEANGERSAFDHALGGEIICYHTLLAINLLPMASYGKVEYWNQRYRETEHSYVRCCVDNDLTIILASPASGIVVTVSSNTC